MTARHTAEENALRGDPGKRAQPVAPIDVLPPSPIEAPAHLAPAARSVWEEIAPDLIRLKILRRSDAAVFGMFCEMIAEARELKTTLDADGYTYETKSAHGNMLRLHPAYAALARVRQQIFMASDRFGLSPMARTALLSQLANNPNAADPFADPRLTPPDGDDDTASLFTASGRSVPNAGPFGLLAT